MFQIRYFSGGTEYFEFQSAESIDALETQIQQRLKQPAIAWQKDGVLTLLPIMQISAIEVQPVGETGPSQRPIADRPLMRPRR